MDRLLGDVRAECAREKALQRQCVLAARWLQDFNEGGGEQRKEISDGSWGDIRRHIAAPVGHEKRIFEEATEEVGQTALGGHCATK